MSRHFVLGSWANADEYDYSGEQLMGHRHGKSVCMDHMLSNGKANLKRYADVPDKPSRKPKVKRSAFEQVCLADSRYNRLQSLLEALEQEHEDGEISWEDFIYARKQLEPRLERAWRQISRYRSWEEDDRENELNNEESIENHNWKEENIKPNILSTASEILMSCSEDNMFRKAYMKIKRTVEILK